MKQNEKNVLLKAGVTTGAMIGIMFTFFALGILLGANVSDTITTNLPQETEEWHEVFVWTPLGAEGNPGAGASGFLEIFFMNISSANSDGYGSNISSTHETWSDANMPATTPNAWANADNFDLQSFESEKTFIIMVRVRYNETHGKEGGNWNGADTDVQITVTCDDWQVGSNINNVSGTRYETSNNSAYTYLYENFVWDNGGSGYQIADDATLTISEIYIEAKY